MANKDKESNEESKEEKKSGSNLILIIIVVLLILILVGGGLAAYFLLGDKPEDQNMQTPAQTAPMKKKMKISRNSDLTQIGPVYPLDQFIVNLLSENGSRFLKVKMDLELSGPELTAELDKKKPLIRDIIIRTLSSKTFQEVSTSRGKEKLKDELVDRINAVLADGNVKNIFFTEFVVQ